MAGGTADRGPRSLKADINVTPLVDVVLVLLIIFMVITPLLQRGKSLQLPAASAGERAQETIETIVLSITADKQLWLETRAVAETDLPAALSARSASARGRQLLIKADASLSMRDLRPVLRCIKAAGLEQIAFAVAQPREAAQ
jgi:biopolymer transport protein TolR